MEFPSAVGWLAVPDQQSMHPLPGARRQPSFPTPHPFERSLSRVPDRVAGD